MSDVLTVEGLGDRGLRPGRPLRVPGDKSVSHRALLLAARAEGTSEVTGLSKGDDVRRTLEAVRAMGADAEARDADAHRGGSIVSVTGGRSRLRPPADLVDVGNSGTSMRLLAGFTAPLPWTTVLRGDESLDRRPMERVAAPLRLMGAAIDAAYPPLTISGGGLHGIDYSLPVPSAQVKGAVLLAGLDADGETVVREQVRTRAHTEEMLAELGADVQVSDDGLTVRLRPSTLGPFRLAVPGDPSQAAFWAVAACITPGSDLTLDGIYVGPGRAGFLDVLKRMDAVIEVDERDDHVADVRVRHSPDLRATTIEGAEVPALIDEIPVLAVAAAVAEGTTVVRDAAELRVKESDRIITVAGGLAAMGASVEPTADGFVVEGRRGSLRGAAVCSHGDHRVAMALAVAGLASAGTTTISGWDAVATSYPDFEADLRACAS